MKKRVQIFSLFIILLLLSPSAFAQENWKIYKNEKANIKFLIPSSFSVFENPDSVSDCDFSISFLTVRYSDFVDDSLRIERDALLKINLSNKKFDKTNKENRFYLDNNHWIAKS